MDKGFAKTKRAPTLIEAMLPILVLVCILAINVWLMGIDAIEGANQIGLLLAAAVAGIVSFRLGHTWKDIEYSALKSINSAMGAMLILLMIGSLSGTWMISGIVPAMIYYGVKILDPSIFLIASCVTCAAIAIATGSSWTTVATIGVALLGVGKTLGFDEGIVAGAILSGAYFGDKISPLSDTTNLSAAMAGTELFTHIKYLMYTTIPSILITLVILGLWGLGWDKTQEEATSEAILATIDSSFNLHPALCIAPLSVLYMIIRRYPALPTLFIGALIGGVLAIALQPDIINQISNIDNHYTSSAFVGIMKAMTTSISIHTPNETINDLLKSGGMSGMLNTVWLILCAMIFGGIMETSGLLIKIASQIIKFAKNTGSLIFSTSMTCIFFNLTASDQYMAIAVPGRMYSDIYRKRKLKPETLSRTLEDSATVTSVLVPWNTCGATQSNVLGVSTIAYAPYTFFCLISPLMTMLHGYLNLKIRRFQNDPAKQ